MAEAIGALRWYLEIDGLTEGIFREVTGLDSETEVIEHRVTGKGGNLIVQKIPGALKWSNIVLKRGVTDDRKLHDWRRQIELGKIETNRKNGTITCYKPDMTPLAKYTFVRAWPCKWVGPSLDATKNELAIEELTLAHEGLERQS
ncbi:phage tail protein [Capsulimonas corticalis]|uniref:Phage tail protein n=1 Tax=Capsulimonas corticalis TaxID=2219043 RepID=A0A402CWY3_9BACT|nr:phage tail protein [Capsulimonas corticalis]BDI34277.1 phage tail protein [Capsulimonas corticalis]